MTTLYQNRPFERFYDCDSGATFSNIEFRNCRFSNCAPSLTEWVRYRTHIQNVTMVKCQEDACYVGPAVVEECLIDGLKTADALFCHGTVFRHVVLRGRIDRIALGNVVIAVRKTEKLRAEEAAFQEANASYYKTVDWALDISQAEFKECDIRSVPARLIRRDPETQVIVAREKALAGEWRRLDLSRTYWNTSIQFMLERGSADTVLVAPKRARHFKDLLAGLKLLREAGVAELD